MSPSVLLVEDSPTQAKQISQILSEAGFSVRHVMDGPDAIQEVLENRPDLIVLDVRLPTMDGFQVCSRLKRNPDTKSIPIIILTSQDSAKQTMAGLQSGADDYIAKDEFALETLLETATELGILR